MSNNVNTTVQGDETKMRLDDMLDWELDKALEIGFVVPHDFETRFRVWIEQILPDRVQSVIERKGDEGYVLRMIQQSQRDAERLMARYYHPDEELGWMDCDGIYAVLNECISAIIKEGQK